MLKASTLCFCQSVESRSQCATRTTSAWKSLLAADYVQPVVPRRHSNPRRLSSWHWNTIYGWICRLILFFGIHLIRVENKTETFLSFDENLINRKQQQCRDGRTQAEKKITRHNRHSSIILNLISNYTHSMGTGEASKRICQGKRRTQSKSRKEIEKLSSFLTCFLNQIFSAVFSVFWWTYFVFSWW